MHTGVRYLQPTRGIMKDYFAKSQITAAAVLQISLLLLDCDMGLKLERLHVLETGFIHVTFKEKHPQVSTFPPSQRLFMQVRAADHK